MPNLIIELSRDSPKPATTHPVVGHFESSGKDLIELPRVAALAGPAAGKLAGFIALHTDPPYTCRD
jgi:hypothetical protein